MGFDIYSTAAQLKALEVIPREYTFLYDTCVGESKAVEDDTAIYDYRKGVKRMSPFVHPGTGGVLMERDGFETRQIGFAEMAPERVITLKDISTRSFGEQVLGSKTPEQRAKELIVRDLKEMAAANQRRREWMVRQVLLTGKLDIFRYTNNGRDKETTLIADYNFTNNFTPDNAWNAAGATIDSDMKEIFDLVYEGCGFVDMILMAPDAANAMLANSDYMKTFDMRNVDMGKINSRYKGQGVRFIGFNADGVEMYSISGKFIDDDGTTKPILPSGTVLALGKGLFKMPHGPVTQVENPGVNAQYKTYIKREVPLRYGDIATKAIKTVLTSCPTVVPENVDAWAVAHVL